MCLKISRLNVSVFSQASTRHLIVLYFSIFLAVKEYYEFIINSGNFLILFFDLCVEITSYLLISSNFRLCGVITKSGNHVTLKIMNN